MKNKILTIMIAVLAVCSCQKQNDVAVPSYAVFQVQASKCGPNYAEIVIRHNGSNSDEYYGFVVEGKVSDLILAVDSFIKYNHAAYSDCYTQRKRVLKLTKLMPDKEYTYVVFQFKNRETIVAEGVDSCCFTTSHGIDSIWNDSSVEMVIKGEVFVYDEYMTEVDYNMEDDNRDYFYRCLVSKNEYKSCEDIRQLIYSKSSEIVEYLDENEGTSLADITMVTRASCRAFYWREPGYYYAMAIAINEKGEPTGRYAISERFHIDDYTKLQKFEWLLGNWNVKDADGNSFNITIENEATNRELKITGWAGLKYKLYATFLPKSDIACLYYQQIGYNVSFVNGETGDIYLNAWYSSDGSTRYYNTQSSQVALLGASNSSTARMECGFTYGSGDYEYGLVYEILFTSVDEKGSFTGTELKFPIKLAKTQ